MNDGFGPFERRSDLVEGDEEPVDGVAQLPGRGTTDAGESLFAEDCDKEIEKLVAAFDPRVIQMRSRSLKIASKSSANAKRKAEVLISTCAPKPTSCSVLT